MNPPAITLPPAEDLQKLAAVSPQAAEAYIKDWIEQTKTLNDIEFARAREEIAASAHKRFFSTLSVILGSFLATMSLLVGFYGIYAKASLWELALFLGPVSGLAGVFLWGYRPKDV